MTTFDKREDAFENKFAHDAELQFKAEARRNKLLGDYQAAQDKLEELVPRWEKAMAELEAAKAALAADEA